MTLECNNSYIRSCRFSETSWPHRVDNQSIMTARSVLTIFFVMQACSVIGPESEDDIPAGQHTPPTPAPAKDIADEECAQTQLVTNVEEPPKIHIDATADKHEKTSAKKQKRKRSSSSSSSSSCSSSSSSCAASRQRRPVVSRSTDQDRGRDVPTCPGGDKACVFGPAGEPAKVPRGSRCFFCDARTIRLRATRKNSGEIIRALKLLADEALQQAFQRIEAATDSGTRSKYEIRLAQARTRTKSLPKIRRGPETAKDKRDKDEHAWERIASEEEKNDVKKNKKDADAMGSKEKHENKRKKDDKELPDKSMKKPRK